MLAFGVHGISHCNIATRWVIVERLMIQLPFLSINHKCCSRRAHFRAMDAKISAPVGSDTLVCSADSKPKVLVIIGATGTGKSQLAVDIAKHHGNCEIVNCDVIQMYTGLDVASAKLIQEETASIPHHMFSFLPPRQPFTVRSFRLMAGHIIDDITRRGKLPIVVGGTMYYAQSILRESLLTTDEDSANQSSHASTMVEGLTESVSSAPAPADVSLGAVAACESMKDYSYDRLSTVDPIMAKRLHPHDFRKIQRALEVYDSTGIPYSELVVRQAERLSAVPSVYDTSVIWLQVFDKAVHNNRLDKRVYKMLTTGMLDELRALRHHLKDGGAVPVSTLPPTPLTMEAMKYVDSEPAKQVDADGSYQGLLQAIGYKEFEDYLAALDGIEDPKLLEAAVISDMFDADGAFQRSALKKASKEAHALSTSSAATALRHGITQLIDVTHRYARVQHRFANNRFEKRGMKMTILDTTHADKWSTDVLSPALQSVQLWLQSKEETSVLTYDVAGKTDAETILKWKKFECETCGKTANGEKEWSDHLRSRGHRNAVSFAEMKRKLFEERGIEIPAKRPRRNTKEPS